MAIWYPKNVKKIYRICPYGMAISNLSQSSNYYYSLKKRMIAYARYMAIIKVFSLDIRKKEKLVGVIFSI